MNIQLPVEPTDKLFVVLGNDIKLLTVEEIKVTVSKFSDYNPETNMPKSETGYQIQYVVCIDTTDKHNIKQLIAVDSDLCFTSFDKAKEYVDNHYVTPHVYNQ